MAHEKDKKRVRFKYEDDVILLREVISRNPFVNGPDVWKEVKSTVLQLTQKLFSIKTIRQHLQLMLEQWKNKEEKNRKSSGVEEPYSEKDVLLQEVSDLVGDIENKKGWRKKMIEKKKAETELAKEIREYAALDFMQSEETTFFFNGEHDYSSDAHVTINSYEVPEDSEVIENKENIYQAPSIEQLDEPGPSSQSKKVDNKCKVSSDKTLNTPRSILGPIRTRAKKTNYIRRSGLDYLKEKQQKEMDLEERRLEIEERKVAVAERNIALAEKKFMLDSEQYKTMFSNQQEVINKLLDVVKKYNQ